MYGCNVSILLCADDIVLIAPNENNLQCMLDYVKDWSKNGGYQLIEIKRKLSILDLSAHSLLQKMLVRWGNS